MPYRVGLLLVVHLAIHVRALAEAPATQPAAASTTRTTTQATSAATDESLRVTEHELSIGDATLRYRAKAGKLPLKDEAGKLKAEMFFVAYEKIDAEGDASVRPITFIFNGGPGAAAVWLHLGTAGPMRIALADDIGNAPAPPYRLVENPHTWLDSTDLVFIDPVGTGYSRAAEGEDPKQFYGVDEDIAWVGEFIRLYTTRWQRWSSPKFLAGESYGTTRAAGLSLHLLEQHGMALNGIILISTVLDFGTISPGDGNDEAYAMFLPAYTATAAYHGKLAPELQHDLDATLREVEAWSLDTYLPALVKGNALAAEQRSAVTAQLSRYTGLSQDLIDKADLRISPSLYQKSLLGDRRIIGRFDGRISGYDTNPLLPFPSYDPSLSRYLTLYSGTFNDYVRRVLNYESDLPYEVLSDRVGPWNWNIGANGHGRGGDLNLVNRLRSAIVQNPHLRVLIASGRYDLATPYFATETTLRQLNIDPALRANITHNLYPGGHMMYHHLPTLRQLDEDVAHLIQGASVPPAGN